MQGKDYTIQITSGTIVRTILLLILAAALWYLRDLVLVVLSAVVIASAMEPGVAALQRMFKMSRLVAIIGMYVGIIGIFFGTLFIFVPPLLNDAASVLQQLPTSLSTLNFNDLTHGLLSWTGINTLSSADILSNISSTISDTTGGAFTTMSAFFGGLTSFVLIVVFSFYFSVQETGVDDFLRIITPLEHEEYVLNLWKRSQDKIGKWMQGQLLLGCLVGILLFLGLTVLGVKHALLLALLAAMFELIPVFGQILAAIPGALIAFTTGGLPLALGVVALYLIVQQFEAHLIYPLVVKKVVGVPPLLVILALLVGLRLFGFLGVLLSVPIAGAIQEFVADLEKRKHRSLVRQQAVDE